MYRKKLLMLLVLSCILLFNSSRALVAEELDIASYKPQWKVGDWWIIRSIRSLIYMHVRATKEKIDPKEWLKNFPEEKRFVYFRFDVVAIEDIKGEECFVVRLSKTDDQGKWIGKYYQEAEFVLLYFRKDSFTLKGTAGYLGERDSIKGYRGQAGYTHPIMGELKSLSSWKPEGEGFRGLTEYNYGPVILKDTDFLSLSFPLFDSAYYERSKKLPRKDADYKEADQTAEIKQETINNKLTDGVLVVTLNSRDDDQCIQKWVKGKPWWVECGYKSKTLKFTEEELSRNPGGMKIRSFLIRSSWD